ncbi:MAG: class I SAM-dependent methyltransferase [Nitrospirae bacterium]|nr:class I SAM-dependent methyltransferase [Nitrospirota bacterium]
MPSEADSYDKRYYAARAQDGDRIALRFYARIVQSYVKRGRVFDYGCGTGHFIKHFVKKSCATIQKTGGYETYVYDISPYALDMVRNLCPDVQISEDPESLQRHSFDLITTLHVLEHIVTPDQTLALFSSLLVEGGKLFFVVPNISGLGRRLKKGAWTGFGDPMHVSLLPSKTWIELTEKAGFRILKTGTDGLWDVPYIKHTPRWIQKLIFYPLPALQVLTGRLFLPYDSGESLIILAECKRK